MPTRKLKDRTVNTGYTLDKWRKRIKERSDITGHVTHLTRFYNNKSDALYTLIKILNERKINGSVSTNGFIVGDNPAVCFQEAPLYGLCQNVYHEQQNKDELGGKIRYDAIGLSFSKRYIYNKGGRPVLYEDKETAKKILPKEEWWRIVNFNISEEKRIIDWTHEREWRIKGELEFDLSETYVLLLNHDFYQIFIQKINPQILKEIKGIIVLQPILE